MKKKQLRGLDELMIVNPGLPGSEAVFLGQDGRLYQVAEPPETETLQEPGQLFLGDDGTLYQVEGLDEIGDLGQIGDFGSLGQFFLGEDGTLYQAQDIQGDNIAGWAGVSGDAPGRFFLGDDGVMYELVSR